MKHFNKVFLLLLLCLIFMIAGCGKNNNPPAVKPSPGGTQTGDKGSWDNATKLFLPDAPGSHVKNCDVASVDYSNCSEGYIMVAYTGDNPKVKLQITGPDKITYTYNLHGDYEVFPLTSASGKYSIGIYENISGTKYSPALTCDIDVNITNEFGPYLYPNQYVNFNADSLPIAQCQDLAYGCDSDIEVVETVYNYIIDNFAYDYDKAATVQSGYLPVVDEIFTSRLGICFDYAAVTATMLRSQGIPTRLEVGYIGDVYHAWISTYIQNIGWINGIIEFDGVNWKLMDPTYASTSRSPEDFIADDNDYLTKFVY